MNGKTLTRSSTDKFLGGVCGGLARYLCQIGRLATQQFALSSMCCECRLDYRTLGLEVESPSGSVDHEQ